MKKLILIAVFIVTAVASNNYLEAREASRRRPVQPEPELNRNNVVEKFIGRNFRPGEELSLIRELGLDRKFFGLKLNHVTVYASSRLTSGAIELKVNNRTTDSKDRISTSQIERIVLSPMIYQDMFGTDIRDLSLYFRGAFRVERIVVAFEETFNNEETINKNINYEFRAGTVLSLRELIGIDNSFIRRRVKYVTVNASTSYPPALLNLRVNQRMVDSAQVVSRIPRNLTLRPRQFEDIWGTEIRSLELYFGGTIRVQNVSVTFEAKDSWYDIPDLKEFVGEFVYPNSNKNLYIRRLLNIGPEYQNRRVDWVMVNLNSDYGVRGEAILKINGQIYGRGELIRDGDQSLKFKINSYNNVIGNDIRTLQVEILNKSRYERIYIKDVGVKFTDLYF